MYLERLFLVLRTVLLRCRLAALTKFFGLGKRMNPAGFWSSFRGGLVRGEGSCCCSWGCVCPSVQITNRDIHVHKRWEDRLVENATSLEMLTAGLVRFRDLNFEDSIRMLDRKVEFDEHQQDNNTYTATVRANKPRVFVHVEIKFAVVHGGSGRLRFMLGDGPWLELVTKIHHGRLIVVVFERLLLALAVRES